MTSGSPQTSTDRQMIGKILEKLAEAEQPLPSSLEFYRLILTAQSKNRPPDLSETLTSLKKKATRRIALGKSALTFSDLAIDWKYIQKLLCELTTLANEHLSPESEEIEHLNQIGADIVLLREVSKAWFQSGTLSPKGVTKSKTVMPLTASVLQATFYPLLSAYASELLPLVKQDLWYQRYCPICGGGSDFSFLDKERGARRLLCSRCDARWIFHRLACPHCGNQDMKTLAYFTDDKSLYRLYTCEKCRRYLKAIDLRKTESDILLPMERILTLDMDRQAYESKYTAE